MNINEKLDTLLKIAFPVASGIRMAKSIGTGGVNAINRFANATKGQWLTSITRKLNNAQTRRYPQEFIAGLKTRGTARTPFGIRKRVKDLQSRLQSQITRSDRISEYVADNNGGIIPEAFNQAMSERLSSLKSRLNLVNGYSQYRYVPKTVPTLDQKLQNAQKGIDTLTQRIFSPNIKSTGSIMSNSLREYIGRKNYLMNQMRSN